MKVITVLSILWGFLVSLPVAAFTILWTPATGTVTSYIVEETSDNGQTWTVNQELQNPQPNANGHIEASITEPSVLTIYRVKASNQNGQALLEHMLIGHDPSTVGSLPVWPIGAQAGSVR